MGTELISSIHNKLLTICEKGNVEQFSQIYEKNIAMMMMSFNKECFIKACENGNKEIVVYLLLQAKSSPLHITKNNLLHHSLKKFIESGISAATLNTQIDVLDYLLFESGLETKVSVKSRVSKLLRIAEESDHPTLLRYVLTNSDLVSEESLAKYNIKHLVDSVIRGNNNEMIKVMLESSQIKNYMDKEINETLEKLISKQNIEMVDYILNLNFFKISKDTIKQEIIDVACMKGNTDMIEYMIFNMEEEKEQFKEKLIVTYKKISYLNNKIAILKVIDSLFDKKYLHDSLSATLNNKGSTEEKKRTIKI